MPVRNILSAPATSSVLLPTRRSHTRSSIPRTKSSSISRLSNEMTTDVMLYPDSGKYGVWHGDASDFRSPENFIVFARRETAVDYWDGEVDDDE